MARSWTPFRSGVLHYHCWDASAVVFNEASSDTHIVSRFGYELLTALESKPGSTTADLVIKLAEMFEDLDGGEREPLIEEALLQLQNIGLITCNAS